MTTRPTTAAIWSQLGSDLRKFIRSRVSDDHLADDLLQDTFVRIHRNLESLSDAERVLAWVYRITRNVIHDHFRRKSEVVSLSEDLPDESEHNSAALIHSARWLTELIGELPDHYQKAARLSEIEGLTQDQVAIRLGISLSGAKSRVQRGRAMLKKVLLGCCDFQFDGRGNVIDIVPRPERTVCKQCDELEGLT